MTREEAIKTLKEHKIMFQHDFGWDISTIKALDMAIKTLEQEPCEDAISRQDAILQVQRYGVGCFDAEEFSPEQSERFVISKLNSLPPVTPKEKTGRWISFGVQGEIDGQIVRAFTCSKCGAISIFRVSNRNIVNGDLCPNCGAKMIEPPESEGNE